MTHVRITIDDSVEFDGSVTEWQRNPPDMFRDQINPNATPQPYMKAVAVAMADAIMGRQSVNLSVMTRKDGWTFEVMYR